MDILEPKSYKSFIELMSEIDEKQHEQRDRGTLFELLVIAYLENEPMYSRLYDKVWKLSDVPAEYNVPKKDTGVDLVARERETGNLIAVQCKFYSKDTTIRKEHIDSFLNEVGKQYYSGGIIVTSTDKWSNNADDALDSRDKLISRISLYNLSESKVDWSSFSFNKPERVKLQSKKTPRPHQIPAIDSVIEGFKADDRGKLIMAPGTGKTYTSMAIAEKMAEEKNGVFRVLYLVPSIQLLSQTLQSWNADIKYESMDSIAVCSDRKVTKSQGENELEDIAAADIGYPATTNYQKLLDYQTHIESRDFSVDFLTVFSTYHSIEVIIEAQKNGFYDFDLVICDEAHRTTGLTENGQDSSPFTKVHSNSNIKTAKRLYQTATPRVYGEDAKKKAEEMSVLIADMSDTSTYGEEFYRIGFGDAIRRDILTDYKVMVLAVDEEVIARRFQQLLARESELEFDDVTKIIGCWNGLVKRKSQSDETLGAPMKRAIAFTGTIKDSKLITDMFSTVVDEYINEVNDQSDQFSVEIEHADGSMNALQKNEKISWLKSEVPDQTCRILSNARFLTEGVDVPDLDAVMFLKPRKSKIDIAQAVGRVMRKVEGKDYGYVILPIGIPAGLDPNTVLDNHEKYRVVWEVLNALRSLDERFDATINQLELNKKKPGQIQVIGVGDAPEDGLIAPEPGSEQLSFSLTDEDWSDLERAIYGKIVKKVGNVRYWEQWSEDVAEIARKHMLRINVMLEDKNSEEFIEFQKFLKGLRHNINESISEQQAIEMLAQHMITKPVFEALFESYSFVQNNPVSKAIDSILNIFDKQGLSKEQEKLEDFYESVRVRAQGIDNLKAKQDIIIQLYDKFFKVGFKDTTERLGVVFTPTVIVDFIIRSVDDVLKKYFNKSLSDEGVNILDPFTGTGTFITRLLQSGLINKEDMFRKYTQELHANEIVLLSYYIAAINIEETYHELMKDVENKYVPFNGIVLTDTFESSEKEDTLDDEFFGDNDERLKRQMEVPITVIWGNPPYSTGQNNENSGNQNKRYPKLEEKIQNTYSKHSTARLRQALYDSYIKAYRWASDRIGSTGVIGFITPNAMVEKNSMDGLRKVLHEEFNSIYVFNLRGAIRGRIGDEAKKEGQNVFDIMTGVTINILVKDGSDNHEIFYHDIGDYLNRNEKFKKISQFESIINIDWDKIIPNDSNDWVNQRDKDYMDFPSLAGENNSYFNLTSLGVQTARDIWVMGFSKEKTISNTLRMVDNFNSEVDRLKNVQNKNEKVSLINADDTFIKWSDVLKNMLVANRKISVDENEVVLSMYRPFTKKYLFYNDYIIHRARNYKKVFGDDNRIIFTTGAGARRDFSALMMDALPNYHTMDTGKGFFLKDASKNQGILEGSRDSNVNEKINESLKLSDDDVFYYVYGVLHSPDYITKYANDLKKEQPRIPVLKNKQAFVEVGRKLADLHLNYENAPAYEGVTIEYRTQTPSYRVEKMKYAKRGQFDKIIFNNDITIKNIPQKAYEYAVNGRPAIEWIIDQYQVNIDKKSKIIDDPNDYSEDEKYIFNLLLSIINVSVQTVDLISSLPALVIEEVVESVK